MTTNQLTYQRNKIAEYEALEKERANREAERLRAQQNLLTQSEQEIRERENLAKYGYVSYQPTKSVTQLESEGKLRPALTNLGIIKEAIPYFWNSIWSPITNLLGGLFKLGS